MKLRIKIIDLVALHSNEIPHDGTEDSTPKQLNKSKHQQLIYKIIPCILFNFVFLKILKKEVICHYSKAQ